MAGVALRRGRYMRWRRRLGRARATGSMASVAPARDGRGGGRMIKDGCPVGEPGMTRVALRRGRNMCRWLRYRPLRQIRAAVTGCALSGRAGVVHVRGCEHHRVQMAGIAGHAGGNMRGQLAPRPNRHIGAAMAGLTPSRRTGVVHDRLCERRDVMAGIALPGIGYVGGVLSFRTRKQIGTVMTV